MTNLSDIQCILLSTASQRDDRSIYPLALTIKPGGGAAKAVEALVSRRLAEERETSCAAAVRRIDGDQRYGVFITAAGLAAIGAVQNDGSLEETADGLAAGEGARPPARTGSKTTLVIDLLRRADGATLPELIEATGWLPHTTRAALTGIRKKGHAVERMKRDGVTCYRLSVAG